MIFYSLTFALFFVALIMLTHLVKDCKKQHIVFLLANIVFYSCWDVRFLLLLTAVILICYYGANLYETNQNRVFITIPVVTCLGVLGICKYLNFFIDSFCEAFNISGIHTLQIILPLGISFYLFQAMSYMFDVKKGTISAEKDFIKLATYISFFPQITSGPIVKAHDFLPQLDRVHRIKKSNVYEGIQLFVLGLTKKVVFADRIGVAVNAVYSAPLAYNNGLLLDIHFKFTVIFLDIPTWRSALLKFWILIWERILIFRILPRIRRIFGADGILVCPAGLGIMFIFLLAEAEQVRERHTVICL